MEDLFRQFWWLLFPIFGMGMGFYGMWTTQRRRRDAIDLLKVYAQRGEQPPEALLKAISSSEAEDDWGWSEETSPASRRRGYSDWNNVMLFLSLSVAFAFAAGYGPDKAQWAFVMVAIIMGGLAIGSLVVALLKRRDAQK